MLGWRNLGIHNIFPFWKGQSHYSASRLQWLQPCLSCFRIQFTWKVQTWMNLFGTHSAPSTAHYHYAIEVHQRQYATSSQGQWDRASSSHSTPSCPYNQAFVQLVLSGPWSTVASSLWSVVLACSLLSAINQVNCLHRFCPWFHVFAGELTRLLSIQLFNFDSIRMDFSQDRYHGWSLR